MGGAATVTAARSGGLTDETSERIRVAVLAATAAGQAGLAALLAGPDIELVGQAALPPHPVRSESPVSGWRPRGADGPTGRSPGAGLPDPGEVDVWVVMGMDPLAGLPAQDAAGQAVVLVGDDPASARRLASLGLRGWAVLLPDFSPDALLAAVRSAHAGLAAADPALLAPLISGFPMAGETVRLGDAEISPRETEVLQLMAQGLANKQIAEALGISPHTVKFHISSIYTRLGATNRAEAVRLGIQRGLIAI